MKRLSLQWRMTLLTALLIAGACICLNLLLYRSGATGMDSLNGYIMQYQLGDAEGLAIEIPDAQMTDFIHHFSQEVDDAKVLYGHNGWAIRQSPLTESCCVWRLTTHYHKVLLILRSC